MAKCCRGYFMANVLFYAVGSLAGGSEMRAFGNGKGHPACGGWPFANMDITI